MLGVSGIGMGRLRQQGGILRPINLRTMHLLQPQRFAGQGEILAQPLAIGLDMRRVVADMQCQIERGIGRKTHPAAACGLHGTHAGRQRPVGNHETHARTSLNRRCIRRWLCAA